MMDPTTLLSKQHIPEFEIKFPVKVLLVDDKKENLFALEKLLEDDSYKTQFIKCTSGNEALKIAIKEELALILLDVQMPEMDGYEVARFLKLNKKTSSIPIIFVTALDHEVNYILEGYKTGAVDYLFKPLNPAITKAKVRAFIHSYLQQKELEQKNVILQDLAMLVDNSLDLMCILDARSLSVKNINPAWKKSLGINKSDVLNTPADVIPGCGSCFEPLRSMEQDEAIIESQMNGEEGEALWFSWSFVKKNNLWYGNGKNITKSKQFEKQLAAANEELEKKVLERTADLVHANKQLKVEIEKRNQAESDLKQNNERLLKANEELDSFVYVASHDLKAPIANIEALLTYLHKKMGHKFTEEEKKLFELLSASVNKFNLTLKDLGQIISVQKDMEEDYADLNISTIVKDVKTDIQNIILENNAEIKEDFAAATIYYSRKNLRSIIYNLLSNAIKYRSPERTPIVEIKAWEEEDFVVLQISDNGLGIKESQQKKMFSMFKRFHTHVEGSGIGLYLLKKIIDNSGGKIELTSTEGVGSIFQVYIKKLQK